MPMDTAGSFQNESGLGVRRFPGFELLLSHHFLMSVIFTTAPVGFDMIAFEADDSMAATARIMLQLFER